MHVQQRLARQFVRVYQMLDTRGWALCGFPQQGQVPAYACSVGFKSLRHPDILITGLPIEDAHQIVAGLYGTIQAGAVYQPGRDYPDIAADRPVRFAPVHPAWQERLCSLHAIVYRSLYDADAADFTVLQLVYPDAAGRWPEDDAFDPAMRVRMVLFDAAPA